MNRIEVIPVQGFPEVSRGSDLALLFMAAAGKSSLALEDKDIVVFKQKVVSKAEGRVVPLQDVKPTGEALALAREQGKDPALVELVLRESVRVVRKGHGVIITETRQGFVCANSGVDLSNVRPGFAALLPLDPDESARRIRKSLEAATGKRLAVVITDTFGRPWRRGQTDVAIGCSGMNPLVSYRGKKDKFGYELRVTEPSVADEVAGAAELAMGKLSGVPAAVVRGVRYRKGDDGARSIVMEKEKDLFR